MLIYETTVEETTCSECGQETEDTMYRVVFKNEPIFEIILCRKCLRNLMETAYEAL